MNKHADDLWERAKVLLSGSEVDHAFLMAFCLEMVERLTDRVREDDIRRTLECLEEEEDLQLINFLIDELEPWRLCPYTPITTKFRIEQAILRSLNRR